MSSQIPIIYFLFGLFVPKCALQSLHHFKITSKCTCWVSWEKHARDYFEVISFYDSKDL